jgi:GTP-binding protein EngB required for normal cell division
MVEYLRGAGIPFACVLTKTDKLNKTELAERTAARGELAASWGAVAVLPFTVNGEEAVKNVRELVSKYLES